MVKNNMTEQNVKAGAKFAAANASAIATFAKNNQQLVKNVATTAYQHEMQQNKNQSNNNDFMSNFSNMNLNNQNTQSSQKKQN